MEETFDTCTVVSHFSEGEEGFATVVLDNKTITIKGDRMTVNNLVSLIENNSKQINSC
jgi:hypothetical protein